MYKILSYGKYCLRMYLLHELWHNEDLYEISSYYIPQKYNENNNNMGYGDGYLWLGGMVLSWGVVLGGGGEITYYYKW